ncbi:MAG: phosphate acyltransferase PlsX [Bacillota bacterium]|nr:phosphate acyltransferase PlsX [Bacillota bacterium]
MRIAIDLMGGDNAPRAMIDGARLIAAAHADWQLVLVGDAAALAQLPASDTIRHIESHSVMAMDESVKNLLNKKDSSIWLATQAVKNGEADAVISAGSTGAQMSAAALLLSRPPSISRPAIGTLLPTLQGPRMMLDLGANTDCDATMMLRFAQMGDVYARCIRGVERPRIALLSNGVEDHKGSKLVKETHTVLKESSLNFIGNLEGRDILYGDYDVMVTDGFSGNIALKSMEGALGVLMMTLKQELTASLPRKLGALMLKSSFNSLKRKFDYRSYGGAPLLGVKGVSIVCHGSSDAEAILSAAATAALAVDSGLVRNICAIGAE